MKIAIAYYQNRVSPVFDVSDKLCVVNIEDGKELERKFTDIPHSNPFIRAKELSTMGLDVLICGAVSRTLERVLMNAGIWVIGFICGDMENVLEAYLRGELQQGHYSIPGCYGNQQSYRFRNRHGMANIFSTQKNSGRR